MIAIARYGSQRRLEVGSNAKQVALFNANMKAEAADNALQAALVATYGKNAGDMRYMMRRLTPEIKALAVAYQDAHRLVLELRSGNN